MYGASIILDDIKTEKASCIDTFYFTIPYSNLTIEKGLAPISDIVKLKYIDICLEFSSLRRDESVITIFCMIKDSPIPAGGYKIEFHCRIDEDTKDFAIPSGESYALGEFTLNTSYRQDLLSNGLDCMILVKFIQCDCVVSDQILCKEEFLKENPEISNNMSLIENLCFILSIPKLEDIFRGRHNLMFMEKSKYIRRTVKFAERIAQYVERKNISTTHQFTDVKLLSTILNYLLHEKEGSISDEDLITIYTEAHCLELKFLKDLSRDFLFYRLSSLEFLEDPYYETLMFEVLKSAVRVNDEYMLEKAEVKLKNSKEEFFDSALFLEKLKSTNIESRFVIHTLKQRYKNPKSGGHIATGEGATSRFFELLENF